MQYPKSVSKSTVIAIVPKIPDGYCLNILASNHVFIIPTKQIKTEQDIITFTESSAYFNLMLFIQHLNAAVSLQKLSSHCVISPNVQGLIDLMGSIRAFTDEIEPLATPQRFGNKAFKIWVERLEMECGGLIDTLLSAFPGLSLEAASYLKVSFGNETRIDYGSGHELSFIAFLCTLFLAGFITLDDLQAVGLKVFPLYLEIVREIQQRYSLEPAGSHGVWGLDDFQFLSYYFGSSQLIDHKYILPKSAMNAEVVEGYHGEYMYLGCIRYINQVKTGPFHEHSPMLWDMSGVAEWRKINQGLLKMFSVEVLQRFVVVQHFLFGSVLSLEKMKYQ